MPDRVTVHTKHADLSLEDIAAALPGTGQVMRSVSHCFGMCWHAALGGNWDLSAYFLRQTRGLLRGLAVIRPKYAAQVAEYDLDFLEPLHQSVLKRERDAFEATFRRAVAQANVYHVDTGHEYVRWTIPRTPPDEALDLSAGS